VLRVDCGLVRASMIVCSVLRVTSLVVQFSLLSDYCVMLKPSSQ